VLVENSINSTVAYNVIGPAITVPITFVQQDLSHCKPQLSYWRSPVTQLAEVITNLLQFIGTVIGW
jgi:type IV secretory pathway VirB2 component (pilin)